MDVLSDVLLAVRLEGAVFFDITARSPFVAQSPPTEVIAAAGGRRRRAPHRLPRHHGRLLLGRSRRRPRSVGAAAGGPDGDLPVGRGKHPGVVAGMRGQPDMPRYYRPVDRGSAVRHRHQRRRLRRGVPDRCGYFACDTRPFNPLLESLPRMVHAPVSEASWGWMSGLLDAAIRASSDRDAGQEAMLAKLSELMLLEALRAHIGGLPPETRNWVAGLRDPEIGSTLRLIHGRYAEPWTLERLARESNMSRSSFADRFTGYVGDPADDLSRALASPGRCAPAPEPFGQRRAGRERRRLPVGVRLQQGVQATGRGSTGRVAAPRRDLSRSLRSWRGRPRRGRGCCPRCP